MDKVELVVAVHLCAAAVHVGLAWLALRRWRRAGRKLAEYGDAEDRCYALAREYATALERVREGA